MGSGGEFITSLITQADELARRIRRWNEWRVEQQIAAEKRTIDLRVEQASETKANLLTAQRLQANTEWVKTSVQIRQWVDWLASRTGRWASAWAFFIGLTIVAGSLGWLSGVNTPPLVGCPTNTSLCYRLRFRGTKLVMTDLSKTKCTTTRKGITCILLNQTQKKSNNSDKQK